MDLPEYIELAVHRMSWSSCASFGSGFMLVFVSSAAYCFVLSAKLVVSDTEESELEDVNESEE